MRLTASQRKLISSLGSARKRRQEGLFVAEGIRSLRELLPVFPLRYLVATSGWLEENGPLADTLAGRPLSDGELLIARNDELERISSMSAPQGVLGVFELPEDENNGEFPATGADELLLALDRIQDPGNLGTILRVADWFGIHTVLASRDTVDVFNPKVLQSTMGALARVKVVYCDLAATLGGLAGKGTAVYGTFLDGDDIYRARLGRGGVIVMGNEGNGISPEVESVVSCRIRIPSFPPDAPTVESLNVGTAAAVTVAEFRRRVNPV